MSSRFTRKERELAYDQITIGGLISVGVAIMATGIAVMVAIISDGSLIEIAVSGSLQQKALLGAGFGYLALGVMAIKVGFRRTTKKYKAHGDDQTSAQVKKGNFLIMIEGEMLEDSKAAKLEELASKLIKEIRAEPAITLSRASVQNTSEHKDILEQE